MPAIQDGPPPGGYPAIRFARRIPNTGPSGFTLFAVAAAVMAYGFYKVCPPRHQYGVRLSEKHKLFKAPNGRFSPFLPSRQ